MTRASTPGCQIDSGRLRIASAQGRAARRLSVYACLFIGTLSKMCHAPPITGSKGIHGRADQLGTGRMLVMTQSLAWPVVTGQVPEMIAILALTGSVGSVTWNVSGPV